MTDSNKINLAVTDNSIVGQGKLDLLTDVLFRHPEQIVPPITHHFSMGIYCREMFIAKGVVVVGKIHRYPHINILSKGDVSILTENGVIRVQAPYTMNAPAGQNCAAYAHEDTVWTTILPTDEKDVDKIEEQFIAKNRQSYLEFAQPLSVGD